MEKPEILQAQYSFIKLLVCMQASLELFDEIEGTKFYRHDLKRVINNSKDKIEKALNSTYSFIDDNEKEETLRSIDRAVHQILDSTLEELFAKGYEPEIDNERD